MFPYQPLLIIYFFYVDELVKSRKKPFFVIPANPGLWSGMTAKPESSYHPHPALPLKGEGKGGGGLQSFWTPVFTGVTTFYETIMLVP